MNGPRELVVTAMDCPTGQLTFDELTVARATKECRKQIDELRSTGNFLSVHQDEGFIAVVNMTFGDVLVDPLHIRDQLKPGANE